MWIEPSRKHVLIIDADTALTERIYDVLRTASEFEPCQCRDGGFEDAGSPTQRPGHLVVVQANLAVQNPAQLVHAAKTRSGCLPVLLIVKPATPAQLEAAVRSGVEGCVLETDSAGEWLEAMRAVAQRECFLSTVVATSLLGHVLARGSDTPRTGVECLTNRELLVLEMIGSGLKTSEIAHRMKVSHRTVESHRENIKHRLGLKDADALVHFACTWIESNSPGAGRGGMGAAMLMPAENPLRLNGDRRPLGDRLG